MDTQLMWLMAAAVVVVVIVALFVVRRQRSERLRQRFGPEYERTVRDADPVGEFEQRVEDISVDHPNVVMNYRAARAIAEEHARGQATTEDLRQAMVHYRALYDELLGQAPVQTEAVAERKLAVGGGRR
jgi:hypothetical protein